ncbi:hypothetical protein [Miniphocaeibacter sp.]|uniref:hypothetical protein n=1 Tax=Miniphocaeibacter sp. TaxID=3100973 RepID=UPI00185B3740|nr:hypothetical protein [Gallicola sp.]
MKIKKIENISGEYLEKVEGTNEWYFQSHFKGEVIDLYEVEGLYKGGYNFEGKNIRIIHFPDGEVYIPFSLQENVYIENPLWDGEIFWILRVDFSNELIEIWKYFPKEDKLEKETVVFLSEIRDCYNLKIQLNPITLYRQDGVILDIIWPEKKIIEMEDSESFYYRDNDKLYFNKWIEEPYFYNSSEEVAVKYHYYEEVVVRDLKTGKVKSRFKGSMVRMPNGTFWLV